MEFDRTLCLFLFLFITLISSSQANNFSVEWTPNPSENLNQWSGRNRFQVNDTIVFKYQKGSDSVLEVKKEDYEKCNKTKPIQKFEDGNTIFKFDKPGPFYFISGNNGTCENGQKLIIVVISPRSATTKSPPSPSPAATSPSMSPAATPPSPMMSTPPTNGPSPMPGSMSPSPSPSPSPMISTPPAGGPSPMSMAPESKTPSPSPIGSSPEGGPLAPGAPSGSAMAPGSENSPEAATAPPPGSSGAFVTPSRFLVLTVTVIGAAFIMRY